MNRVGVSLIAGLLVLPSVGAATVLCARQRKDGTFNGTVKIRTACRTSEVALDPVGLGLQGPPGPQGPAGECPSTCSSSTTTSTTTMIVSTTTVASSGHCGVSGATCQVDADCGSLPGLCTPEGACALACNTSPCANGLLCFDAAQIGLTCVGCKFNTSLCPAPSICGLQADGQQGDGCGSNGPDDDCPVPGPGGTACTISDVCVH